MRARGAAVLAIALAASSLLLVVIAARERTALRALFTLAALLPDGPERLADVPPSGVQPSASFVASDMSTWPAGALAAVQTRLAIANTSAASVRLAAAVDFYRGDCAIAAATLESALRDRPASVTLLSDAAAAHACVARQSALEAGPAAIRAIDRALAALAIEPHADAAQRSFNSATRTLGLLGDRGQFWPAELPAAKKSREDAALAIVAAWANHVLGGAPTTEDIPRLGDLASQAQAAGDSFFADVAHALAAARGTARDTLARAHADYASGRSLYDAGERERAGRLFESAAARFAAVRSPFQLEARVRHATVLYQQRQLENSVRVLNDVRTASIAAKYQAIAARATWLLALADMQGGSIERAAARHVEALTAFEALGDSENAAAVANSAADTMRVAGDYRRGWPMLLRAARTLPRLANRQRRYLIAFNLSLYAQDEGLLRAALLFQDAAVTEAERRGNPLTIVESRLRRAQLQVRRRHPEAAEVDVRGAERTLAALDPSSSAAVYLEAWRQRVQGEIVARGAPHAASERLASLAAEFQRIEPAEVPSILLEAARAAEVAGNVERAEQQLAAGATFALARGGQMQSLEFRAGYLAATWSLFHDRIGLQFARDPARALSIADSTRQALARRDLRVAAPALPVAIAADTVVVYFSVLRDRVLVWTMTAAGTKTRAIAYQEDDLIADIDGFRQSLTSARQDGLDQARVFQRLLDTTLHAAGGGVRRLLIAADGPLGDLPFAALVDPGSRQRLVERYEIALLPGLPSGVSVNSSGTPRLVLAVGYNGASSGLPALRYAEAEAARVGAFYPAARVEAGPAATPEALTAAAPNADVIHIAAHARANRMAPWESRLVLAPDGDADGALTFEAVERWDLRRCRAVVLSACETSTASRARGQGMLSLATPFLHAGAACVIGTLWPVDDRASALFMDLLHHRLADGEAPAAALRAAQLTALASDDPLLRAPSTWAAYVVTAQR